MLLIRYNLNYNKYNGFVKPLYKSINRDYRLIHNAKKDDYGRIIYVINIYINPRYDLEKVKIDLIKELNKILEKKENVIFSIKVMFIYIGNRKGTDIVNDMDDKDILEEVLQKKTLTETNNYRHAEDKKTLDFLLKTRETLKNVEKIDKLELRKSTNISKNMLLFAEKLKISIEKYMALPELGNLETENIEKDNNVMVIDNELKEYFLDKRKEHHREVKKIVLNSMNGAMFLRPAAKNTAKVLLGIDENLYNSLKKYVNKLSTKKFIPSSICNDVNNKDTFDSQWSQVFLDDTKDSLDSQESEVSVKDTDESKLLENLNSPKDKKLRKSLMSLFQQPIEKMESREVENPTDEPLGETPKSDQNLETGISWNMLDNAPTIPAEVNSKAYAVKRKKLKRKHVF